MTIEEVERARLALLKKIKQELLVTGIIIAVAIIALFTATGSTTEGIFFLFLTTFFIAMIAMIICGRR